MSEETDVDAGLMMIQDEQMTEKEGSQEKNSPSEKQSTVIMTGEKLVRVVTPDREIGEGSGLSKLDSSPLGSFQSLQISQSSEKDKMIPYVPPLEGVKVVQFEYTSSEEDCRNFNQIYESLLLEGKEGNLTDLTLGMVLAEKPLAWLQVMHERLKHLIISSEMFKEKKKAEYNARAKAKQNNGGKGMGKHSKGIRFLGVSGKGKGKGKRLHGKGIKTKITPHCTSRNKRAPGSIIGILNELFCFV